VRLIAGNDSDGPGVVEGSTEGSRDAGKNSDC
jgi:hypothetical protein